MSNFWKNLPKPFVGLAPMDGITDQPFRQIVQKYGNPGVIFTEFVNVEGLCHSIKRLLLPLWFDPAQHPIVAQLYGKTPEYFRQCAVLVCYLGFDGVDVNMGCPSKNVASGGAGAGLIKNPKLAVEIIEAVQQGVRDWANGADLADCPDFSDKFIKAVKKLTLNYGDSQIDSQNRQLLPVSVKTRLGYEEPELETWIPALLETQPVVLTIHGRTYRQTFTGRADWDLIGQVVDVAKKLNSKTLIIGNGDVKDYQHGVKLAEKYNLAGVLIGRATQGNPFVFAKDQSFSKLSSEEKAQKLATIALEHAQLYEQTFSQEKKYGFFSMRKHLAWYIKEIPQAKEVRRQLVRANSSQEVEQIFHQFSLL